MDLIQLELVSSLEKIFPEAGPEKDRDPVVLSALQGETISFQVACFYDGKENKYIQIKVSSPISSYIKLREVILVPSSFPSYKETDNGYLRSTPGMYPDILRIRKNNQMKLVAGQWRSLWVDIETTREIQSGHYPITIEFNNEDGRESSRISTELNMIGRELPPLHIKNTRWFHADCLADYYDVPVFSEEHFQIIENFIETAAKRDINMILVPQFTPPLDTAVGGERTTLQLVDVRVNNGNYEFDFTKLKRFIQICIVKGIKYLEMSHLFTQWGAKSAPKIMATIDGVYQRIFGWDTPSDGPEYKTFLSCYLPQLTEQLKLLFVDQITYFHISDEPHLKHLETYRHAVSLVKPYLEGFQIIDAMSNVQFYEMGLTQQPICAIDAIDPFLDKQVPKLWGYYCCDQKLTVSNCFMSMKSSRARVYGIQIYLFNLTGFLHWAFNFYNTQFSTEHINPYEVTDAGDSFPSGDAFVVYPGKDLKPEESLRLMVLYEAMTDLRALKLLESLTNKDYVMGIIEQEAGYRITFQKYPLNSSFYISLRNKINQEIEKYWSYI